MRRLLMVVLGWLSFQFLVGCVNYEKPIYNVVDRFQNFEIRKYEESIVAETEVQGTMDQAGSEGFRRLGGYIFGNNQKISVSKSASASEGEDASARIAMTAPVEIEVSVSEKISMTSPVEIEENEEKTKYLVRFTMPSKYSLSTLPRPNDTRVKIKRREGALFAVMEYSGFWSEKNDRRYLNALVQALGSSKYQAKGPAIFARYDSPYTIWFMRRNEVLIPNIEI